MQVFFMYLLCMHVEYVHLYVWVDAFFVIVVLASALRHSVVVVICCHRLFAHVLFINIELAFSAAGIKYLLHYITTYPL